MNARPLLRMGIATVTSIAMLAALFPTGSTAAPAAVALASPSHTSGGTGQGSKVVFNANWGAMKSRLHGVADFTVAHNMVVITGDPNEMLQVPFSTKGLKNFAVETSIAAATPTLPRLHYFGLFVGGSFGKKPNAVALLYSHDSSTAGDGSLLLWGGDTDHLLPGTRFPMDTAFHLYRAEVQGPYYRLLLDGRAIIPWTAISTGGTGGHLGIMGAFTPLKIRSFRVLLLPPATPSASLDTRGWDAHVLTGSDVHLPTQYGVFHNNVAYAQEVGQPLSSVALSGRILSYHLFFASPQSIVEDNLTLYSSSDMARAAFTSSVMAAKREYSTLPGYREIDTSSLGVGTESLTFAYQHDNNGRVAYRVVTLFYRGTYIASVAADARTESIAGSAPALAQKADWYIGHASSHREG